MKLNEARRRKNNISRYISKIKTPKFHFFGEEPNFFCLFNVCVLLAENRDKLHAYLRKNDIESNFMETTAFAHYF